MIDLTSKYGEINDIEHIKGSKIYPQYQVILDFIMSSIPLKNNRLSIILIWVIVSHKKKKVNTFLDWENQTWYWEKIATFDWEWGRNSAPRDGQKIPCSVFSALKMKSDKNAPLDWLIIRS